MPEGIRDIVDGICHVSLAVVNSAVSNNREFFCLTGEFNVISTRLFEIESTLKKD